MKYCRQHTLMENIFQHFGKTEFFKVYEVEDNKVISSEVSALWNRTWALAGLLQFRNQRSDSVAENRRRSTECTFLRLVLSYSSGSTGRCRHSCGCLI